MNASLDQVTEMTLIFSRLWDWANGVVVEAKFITSVVVGAAGTAATLLQNLGEIRRDRSNQAVEKLETAKVAELLDLLPKLPPGDSFSACKRELELQLANSLNKLEALRAKVSKRAQDPNHGLTLWRRLFILFPPAARPAWIIHALAYLFMAGGPLLVLLLILFRIGDAGTVGDVVVLIVFGSLGFRAWALAERRWAMQSHKLVGKLANPVPVESGPLTTMLVLRKSISWKMLAAQICMWVCVFCAVESLEDIFLAGIDASKSSNISQVEKAKHDAKDGLLLLLASLLAASICRAWASAEWKYGSPSPNTAFAKAIFPVSKPVAMKSWLLAAGYIGAIALLMVSVAAWSRIFEDSIDRAEFAYVWLAASVACNRLLKLRAQPANHSRKDESPELSESAAA
jgi:hypothetical protein